jgi:hypothetical protein
MAMLKIEVAVIPLLLAATPTIADVAPASLRAAD